MLLNAWKGLAVIGIIAALVVSGAGIYAYAADGGLDLGGEVSSGPEVQVIEEASDNGTDTLTVRVGVKVEGKPIAIQGATVEVLSVDVVREGNIVTITIEKVAEGETDENGVVSFDLEHDKYIVVATYNGLTGFGKCNLDEDVYMGILMHNLCWKQNRCQQSLAWAYQYMERMTIQIEMEPEAAAEIM